MNISALKIQKCYKNYKCVQKTKEMQKLHVYFVNESKTNTFEEFKKVILKKSIQSKFIDFCNVYNRYKPNVILKYRILMTLYFIYLYSEDILFNNTHIFDIELKLKSIDLIVSITNEKINVDNIYDALYNFNIAFENWAKIDKDRLIEDCIKSYYFKCEHIDKINNKSLIKKENYNNEEQTQDMINELELQKKDLLKVYLEVM